MSDKSSETIINEIGELYHFTIKENEILTEDVISLYLDKLEEGEEIINDELKLYETKIHINISDARKEITDIKNILTEIGGIYDKIGPKLPILANQQEIFNLKKEYEDLINYQNDLEAQLEFSNTIVNIERELSDFNTNFESKKYMDACNNIVSAFRIFDTQTTKNINLCALHTKITDKKRVIQDFAEFCWLNSFKFGKIGDPSHPDNILFRACDNTELPLNEILSITHKLDTLNENLTHFGHSFFNLIIKPLLFDNTYDLSIDIEKLQLYFQPASKSRSIVDSLSLIEELFNFLNVLFVKGGCGLNEICFSVFLQLGTSIIHEVASSFQTLMDEYNIPFSNFQEISVQANKLNQYLIQKGFIDGSSVIIEQLFVGKISLYCEKHSNSLLNQARKIILNDNTSSIVIDDFAHVDIPHFYKILKLSGLSVCNEEDADFEQHYGDFKNIRPLLFIQKCKIHKKTLSLMNYISKIYDDNSHDVESINFVCQNIRNIFEIFLSIIRAQLVETDLFDHICLVHNDLNYLSNYCNVLNFTLKKFSNDIILHRFSDYFLLFHQTKDYILTKSLIFYKESLHKFADQFMQAIKESPGDSVCTSLSDKIYQYLLKIKITSIEILSTDAYHQVMGSLISFLFENIYLSIVSMEDITVHESFSMGAYLPMLHEHVFDLMNPLDYNDEKKDTYIHIPYFKKFILLIKIINISMPDILSMWENNEDQIRNEISVDCMIHLLKSIFQNTKHRADTILSIKSIQDQIKI